MDLEDQLRALPEISMLSLRQELARRGASLPIELDHEPAKVLLEALRRRGGTLAAIAEAQLLVLKKSADYNQSGMAAQTDEAAAQANRDVYFPFGNYSYAQMIHTKAQRLNSLVMKESAGLPPNHEGIRDTLLDIINYASFWAERLSRETVA